MRFLKSLFGGGSPQEEMSQLLKGPSTEMANEMERVYRNIVSMAQEEAANVDLSAYGILKARLFGVTFMVFAFGAKRKDQALLVEMMNASSGLAMEPFSSPSYRPTISREKAKSLASTYMMEVFRAISSEMRDGPSTPQNMTAGFQKLVGLYEDALKESIGGSFDVHQRFFPQFAGAINANLKHMISCVRGS